MTVLENRLGFGPKCFSRGRGKNGTPLLPTIISFKLHQSTISSLEQHPSRMSLGPNQKYSKNSSSRVVPFQEAPQAGKVQVVNSVVFAYTHTREEFWSGGILKPTEDAEGHTWTLSEM